MCSARSFSAATRVSTQCLEGRLTPAAPPRSTRRHRTVAVVGGMPLLSMLLISTVLAGSAGAATSVPLGTATPFAVLAATAVTDVPTSSITGDTGLSPAAGTNYTGLTQAEVTGSIYSTDGTGPAGNIDNPALLTTEKNDLTTAYIAAAGQPPTSTFSSGDNQLGGQTLTAGVYAFGHAATANITAASPLVLNGQGNANAVFIFQASSDLVTASNSVVQLVNGARACNVFWQVGSSATLDTDSTFVGTIMALTSATLDTGATVQGRVLARNGAVSLDANTITAPAACADTTVTSTSPTSPGTSGPGGTTAALSTTGTVATGADAGTSGGTTSGAGSTTGATAGGATTTAAAVIPSGAPHTGFGGEAHARDAGLIDGGLLALVGSTVLASMSVRRIRTARRTAMHTASS